MYTSPINIALGSFNLLVERAIKYPEVIRAAKVWAMNYGGNLSKQQIHDFFVALRQMPNVHDTWFAWDSLSDEFKRADLNGFKMCFHNELAHVIAETYV